MKIAILPPDVNESIESFSVKDNCIRFGLGAVKGLGEGAIESIMKERSEGGPFKSLFDFCSRVDLRLVNKRAIESLIKGGAFVSLHPNRRELVENLDAVTSSANQDQKQRNRGQFSLFDAVDEDVDLDFQREPELRPCEEYPWEEMLNFEKEVIGIYASGHPLDQEAEMVEIFSRHNISDLADLEEGRETAIAGMVMARRQVVTKKGADMMILTVEDLTGQIEVVAFPKSFEANRELLTTEDRLLIKGKIGDKRDENDSANVILNSAQPLKQLPILKLKLPSFEDTRQLTELRCILQEYPGELPVLLNSESHPDQQVAVGMDFWIVPDESLIQRLCKRYGEDNVILDQPPEQMALPLSA